MTAYTLQRGIRGLLSRRRGVLLTVIALVLFPFIVAFVVDGASPSAVWENAQGNSKFLQGLAIEIFACWVTSSVTPSSRVATTSTPCLSAAPVSFTSGG